MATTLRIRTHYRWLGRHGAWYYTTGYAELTPTGLRPDQGGEARLYATHVQFPGADDYEPLDSALPLLTVDFLEPVGARERNAVAAAGYRLKDDATYYQPWPAGAADAARAYWETRP